MRCLYSTLLCKKRYEPAKRYKDISPLSWEQNRMDPENVMFSCMFSSINLRITLTSFFLYTDFFLLTCGKKVYDPPTGRNRETSS